MEDAQLAKIEDRGCDVEWPDGSEDDPDFEYISFVVGETVAKNGYCVVQMHMTDEDRKAASDQASDIASWQLPKREFDAAYMGRESNDKYAMLPNDDLSVEPEDILSKCDRQLTHLGLLLEPIAPEQFGFEVWGRLNGMLRVPLANLGEEEGLRPRPLSRQDYADGRVVGHLNFLERRKLLMLMFIDNAGGDLWLHPKGAPEASGIHIPLSSNRILVFRNDLMSYSYRPVGRSVALQAWLLSEPAAADPDEAGVVSLPVQLHGDRAHIMSLSNRYPGAESSGPSGAWTFFCAGGDALTRVPKGRWDVDAYYAPERTDAGTTYAIHGGFCPDSALTMFDNGFFTISDEEAHTMSPGQRLVMETGFEVLQRAGHTRDSVQGLHCGVFLGDSGNDWPFLCEAQDSYRILSQSNCITSSRLSYALGLHGPCSTADTACSSSLVAISLAHSSLRKAQAKDGKAIISANCNTALALGCSVMLSPRMYILYCGPGMLSPRGRCFTFDGAADGYARGEGCAGLLIQGSDKDEAAQGMFACLVGSAVNQDGRSASLTAPNGPAQQACIRASMSEAGLAASEITVAECHGTGTALGDPIEVIALRAAMGDRERPILNTSAKSNFGHLEAAAGMAGLIKCVLLLTSSCAPPNVHLCSLNPHMDTAGYPAYFESELADYMENTGISGVSSFGFGGTNARADLWSRCLRGARCTSEVNTAKWLEHRSVYYQRVFHFGRPGPQVSDEMYITGTWDAFAALAKMERAAPGQYVARVTLGESCCEQFRLVLNKDRNQALHPDRSSAGHDAEVLGPDAQGSGKTWLISGATEGALAWTVFEVRLDWRFSWEQGDHKTVTWAATDQIAPVAARSSLQKRIYSIVGTWTSWKFQTMTRSSAEENLWTTSVRIGLSGREEFQLARDGDWSQVIHPAVARAQKTSIPVRGPDHNGDGKTWLLSGFHGETLKIELRVVDGEITVATVSESGGAKIWRSTEEEDWMEYYLSGSWNNWKFSRMTADKWSKGIYRYVVVLGDSGEESFSVVIEKDRELQYYPDIDCAGLEEGAICGPDGQGDGRSWRILGSPGGVYQISLDLTREDAHRAVSWAEVARRGQ